MFYPYHYMDEYGDYYLLDTTDNNVFFDITADVVLLLKIDNEKYCNLALNYNAFISNDDACFSSIEDLKKFIIDCIIKIKLFGEGNL